MIATSTTQPLTCRFQAFSRVPLSPRPPLPTACLSSNRQPYRCTLGLPRSLHMQVYVPLAASVATTTTQPLQAGPEPPAEYLCPISRQIMVNPVMLTKTGHNYEAASISRWLDLHDTDPMSGQLLHSKQLSSNRAIENLITDWAAAHGIVLPSAPMYTPLSGFDRAPAALMYTPLPGSDSTPVPAAAAAATTALGVSMSHTVLNVTQLEDNSSNNFRQPAPRAD
jgi:hypothetical protein